MVHPYFHAVSSAKRHGGTPEQYQQLHDWFDASKAYHGDFRHRVLRHHTEGIFECEKEFGTTLTIALEDGSTTKVPTRLVAEQHVVEDCGYIPSLSDWCNRIEPAGWMNRPQRLSRQLQSEVTTTKEGAA